MQLKERGNYEKKLKKVGIREKINKKKKSERRGERKKK